MEVKGVKCKYKGPQKEIKKGRNKVIKNVEQG